MSIVCKLCVRCHLELVPLLLPPLPTAAATAATAAPAAGAAAVAVAAAVVVATAIAVDDSHWLFSSSQVSAT